MIPPCPRRPTSCRTCGPSSRRPSTSSGRWRPSSSGPVLLFSGGKDSIVMLHLAVKAFAPARVPFPVMHVDTGHNFAEVLAFRDAMVERVGARLIVASVQDDIDAGTARRGHRARGPAATGSRPPRCCAASRRASTTPCSAAPAATRRRPAPRSGCSASATTSASGTRRTSGPSCGTSTTAATARASTSGCSRCRTGPSSTSGSTSPTRASSSRRSTTPTRAGCSSATACGWTTRRSSRGSTASRSRSAWCASAPSATSPAPARSTRRPPPSSR